MTPASDVSDSTYPRTYAASGRWKVLLYALSILVIAACVTGLLWSMLASIEASSRLICTAVCFAILLMGVYVLLWVLRGNIILTATQLIIQGPLRTTVLEKSDILGWRVLPSSPPTLAISTAHKGEVKVGLLFPIDDAFSNWFDNLTSLDEQDKEEELQELDNDEALGFTTDQRRERLVRAQQVGNILSVVSIAVALWSFFYPRPYAPLMFALILLPWVAIELARRSHGLFRIDEKRNQVRPSIATALMFPGFVLTLRAFDFDFIPSVWLAIAAILATGAVLTPLFLIDKSVIRSKSSSVAIVLLMAVYGFGSVMQLNSLLDRRPPEEFHIPVLGKRADRGKSVSYYIDVAPWGPISNKNSISVTEQEFDQIAAGNSATITLRKGALGIQWYYLKDWE